MAKFCSNCGFRLQEGDKFCSNCGKKISSQNQDENLKDNVESNVSSERNNVQPKSNFSSEKRSVSKTANFPKYTGASSYINKIEQHGNKTNIKRVSSLKSFLAVNESIKQKKGCKGCLMVLIAYAIAIFLGYKFLMSMNEVGLSSEEVFVNSLFLAVGILMFIGVFAILILSIFGKKTKVHKQKNEEVVFINNYIDTTHTDENGMPIVKYNNLFLNDNEKLLYAVSAATFIDVEKLVGFETKTRGVDYQHRRFRDLDSDSKGADLRVERSRGKSTAVHDKVRETTFGDYIVTTDRIIFIPQETGKDAFEFSSKNITTVKKVSYDSFMIISGNVQKNILVPYTETSYAIEISNFAVEQSK